MTCCLWTLAIVAVVLFVAFKLLKAKFFPPRPIPFKADWEKDVVYLYQFPRARVVPNLSPYCLKLETWLRMANIKYEVVDCGFMTKSKEGMVPFVELNGVEYPDSSLAIRDLSRIFHKESVDGHGDDSCRGLARAIQVLVESSIAPAMAYFRYTEHFLEMFRADISPPLPAWVKPVVTIVKSLFMRQVKSRFAAAGIGRHPKHEILKIGCDDLRALSEILGDKQFMMGDQPTTVDASVFGMLATAVYVPIDSLHIDFMKEETPNILKYLDRVKERLWPDWKDCTEKLQLNSRYMKNEEYLK